MAARINNKDILIYSDQLFSGIKGLIDIAQKKISIALSAEAVQLYFDIGNFINQGLKKEGKVVYGSKILVSLSQQLTVKFGKGYTYTALTRMCKVSAAFQEQNIPVLSQHLSWSHLIELSGIDNSTKRDFFTQLCKYES